ncbi:MAG: hypothetical protein ACRC5M_05295 [Anaeroplasmataceae bacterium]
MSRTVLILIGASILLTFILMFVIYRIVFFGGSRSKRHDLKPLKKSKIEKINVDENFINAILFALGDISNIVNVSVDNARLKFEVRNVSIVSGEILNQIAPKGVFITGNTVKVLFKFDSKLIMNEIKKRI